MTLHQGPILLPRLLALVSFVMVLFLNHRKMALGSRSLPSRALVLQHASLQLVLIILEVLLIRGRALVEL